MSSDLRRVRIGARSSRLSLAQTSIVSGLLRKSFGTLVEIEVVPVKTRGDKTPPGPRTLGRGGSSTSSNNNSNRSTARTADAPSLQGGAKGAFTGEIEAMLLGDEIDVAVHSMKDMTSVPTRGLTVGATPPRGDPRDAFVAREVGGTFGSLPKGAKVGTSSLRRKAQLLRLRSDVDVVDLHGNVDTRIRRLVEGAGGGLDAIVLAAAGLERLGEGARIAHAFSVDEMVPAVGQGVIAIQMREGDADVARLLSRIDDEGTRLESTCERAFAARLGADCNVPVGGCARALGGSVTMVGMLASEDCSGLSKRTITGPSADVVALGTRLAEELLEEQVDAS
jgi:hydroxymethylbilane synthase